MIFPVDVQTIPEFAVVDVQITSSHSGNSEKGYGIKLQKITLHQTTLYSYLTKHSLLSIAGAYHESVELAVARSRESLFIHNQLEVKNTSFFARVPSNAFISSSPICEGVYRLVGQNGSELLPGVACIDIKEEDLIKYANIPKPGDFAGHGGVGRDDCVQDAITLFDFACASDALYVYVASMPAFKMRDPAMSDFLGVPLVDTDQFLQSVEFQPRDADGVTVASAWEEGELGDEERKSVVFPFRHEIPNLSDKPIVTVFTAPVSKSSGIAAPCPDFALTSVKLHVSIGKYWVSLYVLACMVVCIMERIGMYWHGMYYGMYWYVLFLVCITCIGKYWYVFRGHMCKYSYVLVSIGMYRKMVCIVHTGKYCYVLVYIDLY